ncbi:Fungal protease inhibitor-1 like protein [Argiope bruennichi]|uniref:Fungal protease inhibitor-1 like protein n=1 Tax=Argiope bruennichi TaxID=94029 RepID=A0A8T0F1U3_ARGBR|nr:Fungal protease inhibitor-1 like protein [Argiope bruennichi]
MNKTIFLLLIGVAVASAIVCPENYCEKIECKEVSCSSDEKYTEHGTFCGCCPACLHVIKKGESCFTLLLKGGGAPKATCDDGLECDYKTRTCE